MKTYCNCKNCPCNELKCDCAKGSHLYRILSSDYEKNIPINFYLSQNYPNPFNPITSIDFFVPKKQMVKIEVIDLKGRLINTIHEGITKTGEHTVRWNATDYNHNPISTGVYFYRLTSGNYFKTRKMLYLK